MQTLTGTDKIKQAVDTLVQRYIDDATQKAARINPRYAQLWEVVGKVYNAGGKRFRPYIFDLTYRAMGGQDSKAVVPIAALLELLHVALLMIDDVIDRDYMRHGHPNVAGSYAMLYDELLPDENERYHYANSAAILAENLLISSIYDILAKTSLDSDQRRIVTDLVHTALFTVAGGELLDVETAFVPTDDDDLWRSIALNKTAHYSFVTPMVLGGYLAGAGEDKIETLTRIGEAIGVAFQLADDLLDVFTDTAQTGKAQFSDISEGKATYLLQQTLELASPDDAAYLQSVMKNGLLSAQQGERVRVIMQQCGARAKVEQAIEQHISLAVEQLKYLDLDAGAEDAFRALIDKIAWRTS